MSRTARFGSNPVGCRVHVTLLAHLIALGETAVLGARPAPVFIIHVSVAGVEWLPTPQRPAAGCFP